MPNFKKPKIPSLFDTDYTYEDESLNRSVEAPREQLNLQTEEEASASVDLQLSKLARLRAGAGSANTPLDEQQAASGSRLRPALTFEEAVEVEKRKNQLIENIDIVREKISDTKVRINEVLGANGPDIDFDIDIRRKPRLKRAIKKAFGIKNPTTITYKMYLAALAAKRQLEQQEADDYVGGNWGSPDEEEEGE